MPACAAAQTRRAIASAAHAHARGTQQDFTGAITFEEGRIVRCGIAFESSKRHDCVIRDDCVIHDDVIRESFRFPSFCLVTGGAGITRHIYSYRYTALGSQNACEKSDIKNRRLKKVSSGLKIDDLRK